MVSRGIDKTVEGTERKKGHYRAYGLNGEVIWEQKSFTIGVDQIPPGLPDGMKAMTISDGKKIIAKWDPWGHLPK